MTKEEFLHSTMKDVELRIELYKEQNEYKLDTIHHLAWLIGNYDMHAINASFSKRGKYPKSPLEKKEVVVEDMVLTEEEKEFYTKRFMAKLKFMANKNKNCLGG